MEKIKSNDDYDTIIETLKLINNQLDMKFDKQPVSVYNLTRCRILNFLIDVRESSQSELRKKMNIDSAAITRHLKILEENGDITRCRFSHDQRENRIQITNQGRLANTACDVHKGELYSRIFENWDEEHIRALSTSLKKLKANFNKS
ncbi:hypothetical protein C0Q44_25180 [Paenibacillus sp. PCH8]|uniref:MarR family winged helix-turn-helix transcriptional regulator n=1 Tax=Paenibacillus sp. PCH8 TaxID=2066524 RepID=UPI000CFA58FC|nr:MarR family winged helix-turn-helix transcriptional regulator [Paenibacillus sp. PCH8]PQP81019.1 hypothetical protein C0Q44_25180 [Paenibacillus sp. PCH8]